MSDEQALAEFDGQAKLFPLPNLVLFPHVVQPLHMFEPRYRQLTADALDADRLIAMILLKPGWEEDYANSPKIYSTACLGKIISDQKLDDGRYTIFLRGLARVRIRQELQTDALYRVADVEVLDSISPPHHVEESLRTKLHTAIPTWLGEQETALEQFHALLKKLPVGSFCDIVSFALPLSVEFKQELLEELNVQRRVSRLIELMELDRQAGPQRRFPPDFSEN